MGLERTPPPRVYPTLPATTQTTADSTASDVVNPFAPRNPGVSRSPGPDDLGVSTSRSPVRYPKLGAGTMSEYPIDTSASVEAIRKSPDPTSVSATEATAGPSTPSGLKRKRPITPEPVSQPSTSEGAASTSANPPRTPSAGPPKTPRSTRKTPAQIAAVLNQPAEPLDPIEVSDIIDPSDIDMMDSGAAISSRNNTSRDVFAVQEYGKRYKATRKAVDEAIKACCHRWTFRHVEQTLPLLSRSHREGLRGAWEAASEDMQEKLTERSNVTLEHYKIGPTLQRIDQIIDEGKAFTGDRSTARPDAWRPDITPAALAAATVLPLYDESYRRLREEYLDLHEDCRQRYVSIAKKQAELAELESGVSDGVVELDKTIKLLDGFPNNDMLDWMETVVGKLPGMRDP